METKSDRLASSVVVDELPTRWGNQLNGNDAYAVQLASGSSLPTRWGNQLNGNAGKTETALYLEHSPLAGETN